MIVNLHRVALLTLVPLLLVWSSVAVAQPAEPATGLRELLLEAERPMTLREQIEAAAELTQPDADEAGEGQADWLQEDPLGHLMGQMGEIVDELAEQQTDEPVQTEQQRVVDNLDELIALVEQMQQSASGGGGGQGHGPGQGPGQASGSPTNPASDSTLAGGPGGSGELIDVRAGGRDWADLPPHQREQVLRATEEGFPEGFDDVLAEYYRALAGEEALPDELP